MTREQFITKVESFKLNDRIRLLNNELKVISGDINVDEMLDYSDEDFLSYYTYSTHYVLYELIGGIEHISIGG